MLASRAKFVNTNQNLLKPDTRYNDIINQRGHLHRNLKIVKIEWVEIRYQA